MKKWMFIVLGSAIMLGACGDNGNNEPVPDNDNNNEAENAENAESDGTYDLANGEDLYIGRCMSCHGDNLQGASGPGLEGHSFDEVLAAIEEGPGGMPENLAEGQDAEDIAAWIEDQ